MRPGGDQLSHGGQSSEDTEKRALITGVTGQDGSYLADYLLDLGYSVHGIVRTTSADLSTSRIGHLVEQDRISLHTADITDAVSVERVMARIHPNEVYNLAAQSHVAASFDLPGSTFAATGLGAINVLEAIRQVDPDIHFYQAGSSEMFGSTPPPQSELTSFHPRSPYAVAKVAAHWATINYREAFGIHASNGILFNHESPRRGVTFVTRKITLAVARIVHGLQDELRLGNLDARRDWGHALDYVRAMHMIVNHAEPLELVIGTGESHSVGEFAEIAFEHVGLKWQDFVVVDPKFFRPTEVDYLEADVSAAERELGWRPNVTFAELVSEMVDSDVALIGQVARL